MTVEDVLSRFDEKTVSLAEKLREFLLKNLNGIMEIPDNSVNLIGYGFGSGYKDLICVVMLSKKGIKLGLNRGSELPDPDKLLTGSGKVHRYVEIKDEATIKSPALKKLVSEALKAYKKTQTERMTGAGKK